MVSLRYQHIHYNYIKFITCYGVVTLLSEKRRPRWLFFYEFPNTITVSRSSRSSRICVLVCKSYKHLRERVCKMSDKLSVRYKYIVIDTETDDVVFKNGFREISEFINLISDESISHNTVGKRLSEKNHFEFQNLIIKALIW